MKTLVSLASFGVGIGLSILALLPRENDLSARVRKLEQKLEAAEKDKTELARKLAETEAQLETFKSKASDGAAPANAPVVSPITMPEESSSDSGSTPPSQVPAPITSTERSEKKILFPRLIGANGDVLTADAEFRRSVGTRFVFKDSGGLIAFNARELHPDIFAYLGTTVEAAEKAQAALDQKRIQERIAEANYQAKFKEAATKALELRTRMGSEVALRQAQLNAQKAKEEAARVEAQREQQAAAETELRRARARGRHAVVAANRAHRLPY